MLDLSGCSSSDFTRGTFSLITSKTTQPYQWGRASITELIVKLRVSMKTKRLREVAMSRLVSILVFVGLDRLHLGDELGNESSDLLLCFVGRRWMGLERINERPKVDTKFPAEIIWVLRVN